MATAYENIYALLNGQALLQQVTIAVLAAALAITTEVTTTPNHAARLAWAEGVRADRARLDQQVGAMMLRVISDSRIYGNLAGYTDADVQAVVNGLVDEATAA